MIRIGSPLFLFMDFFLQSLSGEELLWLSCKIPTIRRHYQFWVYSYPTGNPISFSALNLREDLALAQERFGLKHGVVLIGHSMGGLLSRMQVTNSGRTIWDEAFGPKAQELYLRVPNDSRIKQALIFQANPSIERVIFIATPHRGSRLAVGKIGAIAIWLIRLPLDLWNEIPETIAHALNFKRRARFCRPASRGSRQSRRCCMRSIGFPSRQSITRSSETAGGVTLQTARTESSLTGVLTSLQLSPKRLCLLATRPWTILRQSKRYGESCS